MFSKRLAGLALALLASLLLAFVIGAPTLGATGDEPVFEFEFTLETAVRQAGQFEFGNERVPEEFRGGECTAEINPDNTSYPSINPDNHIRMAGTGWTEVENEGDLSPISFTAPNRLKATFEVAKRSSFGATITGSCALPEPTTYVAYLPLVAGRPVPPPPAVCEEATLSAAMADQNATLEFQPWPGAEYDFGIWGPNEVLSLTASRGVFWSLSRGGDVYHYLPANSTYSFTAIWPWPSDGQEIWSSDPITLLASPDYHVRLWFTDATGVRCEIGGWVQWDPPETNRLAEQSAKPAGLRPVFGQ